jgi:hypothetical protein
VLREIDQVVLAVELDERPPIADAPELLGGGNPAGHREETASVRRNHGIEDPRLSGQVDAGHIECREELTGGYGRVDIGVLRARAVPDVRHVNPVATVQGVQVASDGYRRRHERYEYWCEIGSHCQQLGPHIRTRAHYRRARSAISKLSEALGGKQLIAPARRHGDVVLRGQARMRDLDGRCRKCREHGIRAEDGDGHDARLALGGDRGVHQEIRTRMRSPIQAIICSAVQTARTLQKVANHSRRRDRSGWIE